MHHGLNHMIKQLTIMLCLLVFFAINASSSNTLHQVPGTGIFMQTPQGFTASKRFAGFEQVDSMSSLMVMPLKDVSLDEIGQQMFSKEQLKKQNMTMLGREALLFNGRMVGLVFLQQETAAGVVEKIVRLIEGDNELVVLNGIYLSSNKDQVYQPLRHAILSAEWRDTPAPTGFEMVDFTFDVAPGWEIREPGQLGRMVMLSPVDAPKHSTPMDWPLVIVAPSLDDRTVHNLRASSIEMLNNVKGYEFDSIQSEQSREIDGLKSYFIKSTGTDIETSEPLECWQLLLRGQNNKGYYRILALGSDLNSDAGELFEILKSTFTLK